MDLIQSGQKISLNIIKQDTVVEIIGTINEVLDDRLIIELPPYFMRYVEYLDVNCILMAKIFSKLGTIDFNSIVIASPLEEGNLEIEFDINAIKFTQGNEIPFIESIENLVIKTENGEMNTQTFIISTDYIKFYSDEELTLGDNFDCELKLPKDYGTIKFKVTVIEKDIIYDTEYKATIFSMNEQDRETLLYYMYVYANNTPANDEQSDGSEDKTVDNPQSKQETEQNEKNN